jgi:hypothetical protein
MELTTSQLNALNAKLPAGYKIDPVSSKDTRPGARRTEADSLSLEYVSRLPDKRSARDKLLLAVVEGAEARPHVGDAKQRILRVLQSLKKSPYVTTFLQPVDLSASPDYLEVVAEPMDLATVEAKLSANKYETSYHFAMDVRKIWSNSFRCNAKGSDLHSLTMEASALFEQLIEGNEQLVLSDKKDVIHNLHQKIGHMSKEIKDLHVRGPSKTAPKAINEKPMTLQEKKALGQSIRKLDPRLLRGVLSIVRSSMSLDTDCEELVIDLDTLPPKVCRELEHYIDNLPDKLKTPRKEVSLTTTKHHKQDEHSHPTESRPAAQESESSSSDDSEVDQEMPPPSSSAKDSVEAFCLPSMWDSFQQEGMKSEESYGWMLDKSHGLFD